MRRTAGEFVLDWQAHGLSYGVPVSVEQHLLRGLSVLANLSRGVIDQARLRFDPFRVVVVTAASEVLAARLARRGRETAEEIAGRLKRASYAAPQGADVVTVDNGGSLEDGAAAFLAALPQPVSG